MTKYFGLFETDKTEYPLIKDSDKDHWGGFEVGAEKAIEISKLDIICAAYTDECYSGDAFVLYRDNGKLYEVNDNHCSCHGLESWSPEETTKEALLLRGEDYGVWKYYGKEMKEIINAL